MLCREHRELAVEQLLVGEQPDHVALDVTAGLEGEPRGGGPLEPLGVHLAADHCGVVVLEGAQHRVAQEEAGDGEDLVVLGELEARLLRALGADGVDRREDRFDLAAVDATPGVDVVDHGVERGLVVTVVDAGDVRDRLEVDVADAQLDRVVGDARRLGHLRGIERRAAAVLPGGGAAGAGTGIGTGLVAGCAPDEDEQHDGCECGVPAHGGPPGLVKG